MITLYYIGGPWDLTKRALPERPKDIVILREFEPPAYVGDVTAGTVRNPNTSDIVVRDHCYLVRKVGRETFVALHEGVRP